MTDPLGLIGASGSAFPARPSAPADDTVPGSGPGFRDLLLANLSEVNRLQQDATRAVEDLQVGRRTDLEGVLIATQKADLAFRTLQAVRNRMIQAYEDIQQMRV